MYRYEMRNNMVATSRFVLRLSLCLIVLAVVGLLKSAAGNEPSETAQRLDASYRPDSLQQTPNYKGSLQPRPARSHPEGFCPYTNL